MDKVLGQITREDIYNIVIPMASVTFVWISQYFTTLLSRERQWKYTKEKSSKDKFCDYFTCIIGLGIIIMLVYLCFIFLIEIFFGILLSVECLKKAYFYFSIICHVLIFININKKEKFQFKQKYKNEKRWLQLAEKMPIVFSGIIWSCIFFKYENCIIRITSVLMIIFGMVFIFMLEDNPTYKYKCVKFYFHNGAVVDNIDIKKIRQKGNWIIAESINCKNEYRFRIKDIERVEYR